jgi:ribosomal protein L37AE/L43A
MAIQATLKAVGGEMYEVKICSQCKKHEGQILNSVKNAEYASEEEWICTFCDKENMIKG